MFEPAINIFEKLISEFTWKRLFFIAAALAIVVIAAVMYESYTNSFRLARLEKSSELIEKLVEMNEKMIDVDDELLLAAYAGLKRQLAESIGSSQEGKVMNPRIVNGLFTLFPWVILSIIFIMVTSKGEGSTRDTLFGVSLLAVPIILVAMLVPTFEQQWINHWLLPWSSMIVLVVLITMWGKTKKRKKKAHTVSKS